MAAVLHPADERCALFRSYARDRSKDGVVLRVACRLDEFLQRIGSEQTGADVLAYQRDVEGKEESACLYLACLFCGCKQVGDTLCAKALHVAQDDGVLADMKQVGILAHPSKIDKLLKRLLTQTIDVHSLF